jgi:hypothetical protein
MARHETVRDKLAQHKIVTTNTEIDRALERARDLQG